MLRNVASQKYRVYAWDTTTGLAKTGDAANISAYITKDDGTPAATNDVAPTEASSTNEPGYYDFDLTQAETAAAKISLSPKSATANIQVIACPPVVYTVPQYHSLLGIASDGDISGNVDGAVASVTAGVTLANGAVTNASLAGNMEIVFETDFATNYNTTNDQWVVSSSAVASVTGAVGSVTGAVGSVTGNVGGNVTGSVGSVLGGINTSGGTITTLDGLDTAQDSQHSTTQSAISTAQTSISIIRNSLVVATGTISGTPTTTAFDTNLTDADGFWDDCLLLIDSNALSGQTKPIQAYLNLNGQITVDEPFTSAPSSGDTFRILAHHVHPISQIQSGLATSSALATAQADLDTITGADGVNLATSQPNYAPSTHAAADVWSVATRVLTANTNLNDLDAAGVRTAVGLAAANLDTQIAALPTQAEITGGAYALDTDANGRIRIVDGTAAGELDTASGLIAGIAGTKNTFDDLNDLAFADIWTGQLTESYAAAGTAFTPAQGLFAIHQELQEFANSGTTRTVKKLDGSTTAMTGTYDDATNPTSLTRAT